MRLRRSHLTFGQIADEWAREVSSQPGALSRDEILHEIIRAVWRGDFEDEDGENSRLTIHQNPRGGATRVGGKFVDEHHHRTDATKKVLFNRRKLLCVLAPICPPGVPQAPLFRLRFLDPQPEPWDSVKADVRWDILAALTPDEYILGFRERYLEPLTISKEDFGRWCDDQSHQRPTFWFGTSESGKLKAAREAPSISGRRRKPGRPHGPYLPLLHKALDRLATNYGLNAVELWQWNALRRGVEINLGENGPGLPKDTQFKKVCKHWFAAARRSGNYARRR